MEHPAAESGLQIIIFCKMSSRLLCSILWSSPDVSVLPGNRRNIAEIFSDVNILWQKKFNSHTIYVWACAGIYNRENEMGGFWHTAVSIGKNLGFDLFSSGRLRFLTQNLSTKWRLELLKIILTLYVAYSKKFSGHCKGQRKLPWHFSCDSETKLSLKVPKSFVVP